MRLSEGLRLHQKSRLAIVGAGGKSTILFNSAAELESPVVLAATAHLCADQLNLATSHFFVEKPSDVNNIFQKEFQGSLLLTGPIGERNRTRGLSDEEINLVRENCERLGLPLIIEADGSRRLPLKAPAEFEPPVPGWVNQVVVVTGLSGLGKILNEEVVFRAERFAQITDSSIGQEISLAMVIKYLLAEEGGLKNIPQNAIRSVFFNQLDQAVINGKEREAPSKGLLEKYQQVIWGAAARDIPDNRVVERFERVAGIVLAAGGSRRFGSPKQLLYWQGKPFIWHVVQKGLRAGLSPLVVVTGAYHELVEDAISEFSIVRVHNSNWERGLSTSVKRGLAKVADQVGAAIFLMSDVPQLPEQLIKDLIHAHRTKNGLIFSTSCRGNFINPVLFDQRCFEDLLNLEGDRGGKALFQKYPVEAIEWNNPDEVKDIDREEDYEWLRSWNG
ncbi:MAG: selenium cofactor biosynthesis protein YqeC [Chloroflexota bacterium]|nr:MAG: MoeA-like protein [Bellilinea sp.]